MTFKIYQAANIRLLYIIILLTTAFTSCKKNRPDKLEGDKEQLVGRWAWIMTEEKIGCQEFSEFNYFSSETTSINYELEFESTGHLTLFENGNEIERFFLKFKSFSYNEAGYWRYAMLLNNDEDELVGGTIEGDTLLVGFFPYRASSDGCTLYRNELARK